MMQQSKLTSRAMWAQKDWMKGTFLVHCRKSMDMRYSRRDRPGPAGRHTCSWCRWLRQPDARAPRSIFPGCASPASEGRDLEYLVDESVWPP